MENDLHSNVHKLREMMSADHRSTQLIGTQGMKVGGIPY